MCLICLEYEKGKISAYEMMENLNDSSELFSCISEEHINEIYDILWKDILDDGARP